MPIVHECEYGACQKSKDHVNWQVHRQMNVFISRLDDQQRRGYVGLESKQLGHGGDTPNTDRRDGCGNYPQGTERIG
jgi:hypothetical protein